MEKFNGRRLRWRLVRLLRGSDREIKTTVIHELEILWRYYRLKRRRALHSLLDVSGGWG